MCGWPRRTVSRVTRGGRSGCTHRALRVHAPGTQRVVAAAATITTIIPTTTTHPCVDARHDTMGTHRHVGHVTRWRRIVAVLVVSGLWFQMTIEHMPSS